MRITWILGVVVVTLSAQTPPAAPRGFGPPMASAELAERPVPKPEEKPHAEKAGNAPPSPAVTSARTRQPKPSTEQS